VGVTEPPAEMFGKLMRIPDGAMETYYDLLLGEPVPPGEAVSAKRALARRIAERFHGAGAAEAAEAQFDRLHKDHLPPEEMEDAVIAAGALTADGRVHLPAVLADHFGLSRSEARRLLGQGGVRLNGEPLDGGELDLDPERLRDGVIQVGRRRFRRLRLSS
jgi:tyrosyl-tRNA synthetase